MLAGCLWSKAHSPSLKSGIPLSGEARCTRLIIHALHTTSYLAGFSGEACALNASRHWVTAYLQEGESSVWCVDDQKGVSNVWRLPPAWRRSAAVGCAPQVCASVGPPWRGVTSPSLSSR